MEILRYLSSFLCLIYLCVLFATETTAPPVEDDGKFFFICSPLFKKKNTLTSFTCTETNLKCFNVFHFVPFKYLKIFFSFFLKIERTNLLQQSQIIIIKDIYVFKGEVSVTTCSE